MRLPDPRAAAGTAPGADTAFFGHPRGLSTLFFTELWERFSYYGMRAILILFMTASAAEGGLGFGVAKAGAIYGLYTSMVYVMSLPGGWLADRKLGQRRAVLIGGIVIALGHFSMALPGVTTFYLGLLLIVTGTGLLKPNITTMVGQLYQPGDGRRDAGFSIYYMGINIGAFLAPLVCGYLGQRVDWHLGFGMAGIGMTLGLIQYVYGGRNLGSAGLPHEVPENRRPIAWGRMVPIGLGVAAVLAALGGTGKLAISAENLSNVFGLLLLMTVVTVFAVMFSSGSWTPEERRRLVVIVVLFGAASLFWSSFEQAGSTLNLFAQRNTDSSIAGLSFPSSWYQSLNSLFLIGLAPGVAWLWVRLGDRQPSVPMKFVLGLFFVGLGFVVLAAASSLSASGGRVGPGWLIATYFLHTIGELCLSPVGLSAITKLAPVRMGGLMMGAWFLSNAVGNFTGGRLAGFYETLPLTTLFPLVSSVGLGGALLLLLFTGKIARLMGGVR